ncbi:YceI family protein [Robiginitalea sp. SC105]|uniref:YceI family protein n=1 Tax=Robiginitalea sp. SC105 TaxID=2762332 RepID=UPI00163AB9B3|nr:YceI family protein [Robiginitalea sp. SC105]MBC2839447.1 YceI family protein [Robiginitalea sp. SC105]
MSRSYFLLACCFFLACQARAQDRWITRKGEVRINASTPLEDIDATNHQVNAILSPADEGFAVVMLVSEFQFRRKLMQEHFNENYMESHRYPKATFSGRIQGISGLDPGETRHLPVSGTLTIHGIPREVETEAEVTRQGDRWLVGANFTVRTEDHGIDIPTIVFKKIAEEVQVYVDLALEATGK